MNILRRMKSVSLRPMIVTYNNIINACAFSCHPDDDPSVVLRIALEALQEAQTTCGANFITYGTCLRAIANFEKDRIERWRLTRDIFQQCCRDGQLTTSVMKQLRVSVSAAQYTMILSEAVDRKTGRLRHEFTKNATSNFQGQGRLI
jgi:hypothetical protein